jgi:hypothetical protein
MMKSGIIEWAGSLAGMVESEMPRNKHEEEYL